MNDEVMQRLEQLGPRDKIIEEIEELRAEEMMKKRVTEKKTTKKARQKAKKKLAKEEEPEMKSSAEFSREASWEQDCAQGRAFFLSKDYPR